jgi:large subunit ribosomal protein L15
LTSRTGGTVAPGFEGGQTPLHRRLPKFGFSSLKARYVAEVRLHELALVDGDVVDLDALKNANLVRRDVLSAKVVLSGALDKSVTVKGLRVTKGARAAIEAAGGKIED